MSDSTAAQSAVVRLVDDQLEHLADLIAARLQAASARDTAVRSLVDAATVARELGVSRATVYARASELGAVRLGDGSRARLRFDIERAREALRSGSTAQPPKPVRAVRKPQMRRREHVLQSRPRRVKP